MKLTYAIAIIALVGVTASPPAYSQVIKIPLEAIQLYDQSLDAAAYSPEKFRELQAKAWEIISKVVSASDLGRPDSQFVNGPNREIFLLFQELTGATPEHVLTEYVRARAIDLTHEIATINRDPSINLARKAEKQLFLEFTLQAAKGAARAANYADSAAGPVASSAKPSATQNPPTNSQASQVRQPITWEQPISHRSPPPKGAVANIASGVWGFVEGSLECLFMPTFYDLHGGP